MHLFFWFNNFLDARAEVREEIWLGESLRHHDFFLIFLDLYSFQHGISVSPQNLIKAFESNLKQFAPPPPMMKLRRLIVRFSKFLLGRPFSVKLRLFGFLSGVLPHGMRYSHLGNGVHNRAISITQWGFISG